MENRSSDKETIEKKQKNELSEKKIHTVVFCASVHKYRTKNPEKVFVSVPKSDEIREKWFRASNWVSERSKSCLYCCEDHFDKKHVYPGLNVGTCNEAFHALQKYNWNDCATDTPGISSVVKIKRRWYHSSQGSNTCKSSGHSSYLSSSTSSILSKPKEIAKLFRPNKKSEKNYSQKSSSNTSVKLKPDKTCNTCSYVDESTSENRWISKGIRSPVSNVDGELTDGSSSSKLTNPVFSNQRQSLSRRSNKFSKSRKRSTMSVIREGKLEFHCGDYFTTSPHHISATRGVKQHKFIRHSKVAPEGKSPFIMNANHSRLLIEEPKEKNGPSLESMGFGKGDLEIEGLHVPQKTSIHEALYQRVATFMNPDICIIADSHEFFCHKIVLQCYSEYFEEVKNHTEIFVDGVSKRAFIAIYNWMLAPGYEGLQYIQKNNILEVLIASKILVIKELENQCLAFIDSNEAFSEENAFLLFIDASRRHQREIMELMVPRIQMFFLVLVSSMEFVELEVDDLCAILQSNYIIVHCELEVFMAAVKWLKAKWQDRAKLLATVMKCIRFGLMSPAQLVDVRKNPMSPEFMEITTDKTVQLLIEDGLSYSVENGLSGKTERHVQRCELLKLKIPEPRNWANTKKEYKSYGDFLSYLNEISQNPRSFYEEMKKTGQNEGNKYTKEAPSVSSSDDDSEDSHMNQTHRLTQVGSKRPSLSDLLCKDKTKDAKNLMAKGATKEMKRLGKTKKLNEQKYDVESSVKAEQPTNNPFKLIDLPYKQPAKERNPSAVKLSKKRLSLREGAAIVIQSTYRGYVVRKMLKRDSEETNRKRKPSKKLTLDRMFLRVKHSYSDQEVDDESPLKNKFLPTKIREQSKVILKRSSSTESNESVISVKEGPVRARRALPLNSPNNGILLIGGVNPTTKFPSGSEANQIHRFSVENNSWETMDSMPSPRYYHGSAYLRGKLYVVGGCNPENEDNNVPSLYNDNLSYDLMSNVWHKEPELKTPRRSFGLIAYRHNLFAIGGQDKNDTILSSVERYDPDKRIWEEVSPLPDPTIGAAISVFKNQLWVAGGMNGNSANVNVSKDVWCYDPYSDVWVKKQPLRFGRAFASLTTYEDSLLLVGGVTSEGGGIVSNDHIDVWDSENSVWKLKGNIDLPRHGHSVAFIGSIMILMGGVTTKTVKGLNQIDSICMKTGSRYQHISPLPSPLVGHSCTITPPPNELLRSV